jgi:outer membrane protein assembly factor BamA
MPSLRRVFLPAFILVSALSAHAQKYPINKITIKGSAPYTDDEILAIAQFKPGDVMTVDTLANPAQHLLDTGMFDSAEMSLGGPGNRTAILDLKPAPLDKLLPASFENFVWWTPEELREELHKRVPIYRGVCSDAGNLPDLIQAALEQMVSEKSVQVITSHTIVEPTTDHPQRVVDFRILKPAVSFATINITGAPPALDTMMQKTTAQVAKSRYNEGLIGLTTEDVLLQPVRESGYITASLTNMQRNVTVSPTAITVAYSAQLVSGEPYKVSTITWDPTPIYTADAFNKDAKLHANDIASTKLLRETEAKPLAAYRAQGYIDAYIDPAPKLDDATHTVAYALHVIPGEVYRVNKISSHGLSPDAQQEFDTNWRMKSGDVYDESYVVHFLANINSYKHLTFYAGGFRSIGDPETRLVDITIDFFPAGGGHR